MRRLAFILGSLVVAGAPSAVEAQPPGFWLTGIPDGFRDGRVEGLSQNGAMAIGWTYRDTPNNVAPGFRWTVGTGRVDFEYGPGNPAYSLAQATDSARSTIAGWAFGGTFPATAERAYRRVGNGPFQDLGVLPNDTRSQARGVSGDGSVIVGFSDNYPTQITSEAFRWTAAQGMVPLGHVGGNSSEANGISRDGSTIVGEDWLGSADVRAFKWTAAGGMQVLPPLPGTPLHFARAYAANADGSIIVGSAYSPNMGTPAVYWDATGVHSLGMPGLSTSATARVVSDAGHVIGGSASGQGLPETAFLWTSSTGMMYLSDYLTMQGIQTPANYRLVSVRSLSGDGLTIGGQAVNLLTNRTEGFVTTIPAPAAICILAPAFGLVFRRRAR